MRTSVFVYGTLTSPQVLKILLGREVSIIRPARLEGYIRHPALNHVFPGMIGSNSNSCVDGCILPNLSPTEMLLFDWYEGDEYERRSVQVMTENGKVDVETYVWKSHLLNELNVQAEWSFEDFCEHHLDWYLEHTVGPCREEMERLGMTK
jgi:gamma-glutamylcyclotransferase (GGCT)/AIG2-like uncharacterized protein YtfP